MFAHRTRLCRNVCSTPLPLCRRVPLVRTGAAGGTAIRGLQALSEGYLLTSVVWSASTVYIIEREFWKVRAAVPWAASWIVHWGWVACA